MKIGNKTFCGGTHIMGILNLSPESFFEDSRVSAKDILMRAQKMIDDGAEILDLGAQSTRPNYVLISIDEEILRLRSALQILKSEIDVPISVDTFRPEVAMVALDCGADMINDIWGLQQDGDMAKAIADYGASVCIMHNKTNNRYGNSHNIIDNLNCDSLNKNEYLDVHNKTHKRNIDMHNKIDNQYTDMLNEIRSFFETSLGIAKNANIDFDKIVLDGGIGFGKDKAQNWELLHNYEKISIQGLPLLLGTSRKSMFGGEVKDRLEPTLDSTKLAVEKNILFVRVHDIRENKQAIEQASTYYKLG